MEGYISEPVERFRQNAIDNTKPIEPVYPEMIIPIFSSIRTIFIARAGIAATSQLTFNTHHYAPRLIQAGFNVAKVERAVAIRAIALRRNMIPGDFKTSRFTMNGVEMQYNLYIRKNGEAVIGTIFKVE